MSFNSVVISGGGLNGFGILGGLQYMIDNNLFNNLKYFSGTSIGSVICFFISIGYTPIEIIVYCIINKVFDKLEIKSLDSFFKGDGIYDFSIFKKHIERMTIEKIGYSPTLIELYKNLGKTLYTCTYNITKKIKEYISYHNYPDMLCIDAIELSCSLPFIFNDCYFMEQIYIDGGFVDNCPYSAILEKDSEIVIFNIDHNDNGDYKKLIDKFYTIITIPIVELQTLQLKNLDNYKIISLHFDSFKIYDFNITNHDKLDLFSLGYNLTKIFFIK
jgi:predicted acylesterase/phospholipase RssA